MKKPTGKQTSWSKPLTLLSLAAATVGTFARIRQARVNEADYLRNLKPQAGLAKTAGQNYEALLRSSLPSERHFVHVKRAAKLAGATLPEFVNYWLLQKDAKRDRHVAFSYMAAQGMPPSVI